MCCVNNYNCPYWVLLAGVPMQKARCTRLQSNQTGSQPKALPKNTSKSSVRLLDTAAQQLRGPLGGDLAENQSCVLLSLPGEGGPEEFQGLHADIPIPAESRTETEEFIADLVDKKAEFYLAHVTPPEHKGDEDAARLLRYIDPVTGLPGVAEVYRRQVLVASAWLPHGGWMHMGNAMNMAVHGYKINQVCHDAKGSIFKNDFTPLFNQEQVEHQCQLRQQLGEAMIEALPPTGTDNPGLGGREGDTDRLPVVRSGLPSNGSCSSARSV